MSLELEFICGRRPGNLLANIRPNGGLAKLDDDLALGRVEVLSKIPLIGVFTSTSKPSTSHLSLMMMLTHHLSKLFGGDGLSGRIGLSCGPFKNFLGL